MNARLFDEMLLEAQVWFDDLVEDVMRSWMGSRLPQEGEDGEQYETEADLYGEEERPAVEEPGGDFEVDEEQPEFS